MKTGLYYKKDKKVRLIARFASASEPGGMPRSKYEYIAECWAYTRQLSQDQIFEAAHFGKEETRLFVLNYRNNLKIYDIIEYKGNYYEITRLDTQDDYNGELFVYTKDAKHFSMND